MEPEQAQDMATRGLSNPGILRTGVMYWITLAIMVLIFLTVLYFLFRTYRHIKSRRMNKEKAPEIRSTDS